MDRDQLVNKLKELGADEKDVEATIKNLSEVVAKRALVGYLSNLKKEQLSSLKSLNESEMIQYIKENGNNLPPFPTEDLDIIREQVWNEYLREMQK
jgi:hypothetical protein